MTNHEIHRSARNRFRLDRLEDRECLPLRRFPYYMNLGYCRSIGYHKNQICSWRAKVLLKDGTYRHARLGLSTDQHD